MELTGEVNRNIPSIYCPLICAPNHAVFGSVGVQLEVAEIFVQGTSCLLQNVLIERKSVLLSNTLHNVVDPRILVRQDWVPYDRVADAHAILAVAFLHGGQIMKHSFDWSPFSHHWLPRIEVKHH